MNKLKLYTDDDYRENVLKSYTEKELAQDILETIIEEDKLHGINSYPSNLNQIKEVNKNGRNR